jgi:hypothetical protein
MFEAEVSESFLAPPCSDNGAARPEWPLPPPLPPLPPVPPPVPPVVRPSPAVSELRAMLAQVASVDPVELPEAQALADARELLALRAQLDAVLLTRIGDVDVRALHRLDASPTTAGWIRRQQTTVEASTLTLARRSPGCPGCRTPCAPDS